MNKEQYLKWIKARNPNPAKWVHKACVEADNLIRDTTLSNFERYLKVSRIEPQSLREFIYNMACAHFGSIDVDSLMIELEMYPDWMEKARGTEQ